MYRTDVAGYYPSVDAEQLQSTMQESGCLVPAAVLILKVLREWQLRDGLKGLPIGPEVSAVIGNFLLRPVDRSLEANRYEYLRWSDDILTSETRSRPVGIPWTYLTPSFRAFGWLVL
jgi:hypothetical protein